MPAKYRAWSEPGHRPLHPGGRLVFGQPTAAWLRVRARRLHEGITVHQVAAHGQPHIRERGKAWMDFTVAHAASVHYAQSRPMPLAAMKALNLPFTTDCSGSTTGCYFYAGAPDPHGRGYDGSGFTGTIRDHLRHVDIAAHLRLMDCIVYGSGTRSHVVMVHTPGPDPIVFSHGQESGPQLYRHSVELAYHGGYCTLHDAGVA